MKCPHRGQVVAALFSGTCSPKRFALSLLLRKNYQGKIATVTIGSNPYLATGLRCRFGKVA